MMQGLVAVGRGGAIFASLALVACQQSNAGTQGGAPGSAAPATPNASAVAPTAAQAAPAPSADHSAVRYAVFDVILGDVLNVRAEPNGKSKKVYSFSPEVTSITLTGRNQQNAGTPWVEVRFEGGTGWVNRQYLTEMHPGGGCNDPDLTAEIRKLMRAVADADGAALREIVSPARGLRVRYIWVNKPVTFPHAEVDGVFTSPVSKSWGTEQGTGDFPPQITGTFRELVLPSLKETIAGKGAKEKCGEFLVGDAPSHIEWPAELSRLTQVSFYSPGDGKDWKSWVAGFEYVDGKPFVSDLVGYR